MAQPANISALLVAHPGRLCDSLKALLRTITYLTLVDQTDDTYKALSLVVEHSPNLLLLGSNLPMNRVETLLAATKDRCPQTRSVVLVDNMEEWWQAKAAGADSVLLAGFPSATFSATIDHLLLPEQI